MRCGSLWWRGGGWGGVWNWFLFMWTNLFCFVLYRFSLIIDRWCLTGLDVEKKVYRFIFWGEDVDVYVYDV